MKPNLCGRNWSQSAFKYAGSTNWSWFLSQNTEKAHSCAKYLKRLFEAQFVENFTPRWVKERKLYGSIFWTWIFFIYMRVTSTLQSVSFLERIHRKILVRELLVYFCCTCRKTDFGTEWNGRKCRQKMSTDPLLTVNFRPKSPGHNSWGDCYFDYKST